jgi:hypothetical protein
MAIIGQDSILKSDWQETDYYILSLASRTPLKEEDFAFRKMRYCALPMACPCFDNTPFLYTLPTGRGGAEGAAAHPPPVFWANKASQAIFASHLGNIGL